MALQLVWSDEQTVRPVDSALIGKLEQLLQIAAKKEGLNIGEVALTFVDDDAMRELNRQYRGVDRTTDVLSFAMMEKSEDEPDIVFDGDGPEDPDGGLLGDIVISVEKALAQSEEYGHSFEREIGFLFVHGFLHLIGYDHGDEASEKEMFALQEEILREAGLTR